MVALLAKTYLITRVTERAITAITGSNLIAFFARSLCANIARKVAVAAVVIEAFHTLTNKWAVTCSRVFPRLTTIAFAIDTLNF